MGFILHVLLTAGLLMIVAKVVNGIDIASPKVALWSALALGIINALIRPLIILLTLPFTLITFGLFLIVINALMLQLAAAFVKGFNIKGFVPAFLGSALLTALNILIAIVV